MNVQARVFEWRHIVAVDLTCSQLYQGTSVQAQIVRVPRLLHYYIIHSSDQVIIIKYIHTSNRLAAVILRVLPFLFQCRLANI
jgi:hypothetical protein